MPALSSGAARVRRHPDVAAAAVLAAVLCVFFAPLFAGHQLGHSHILYDSFPWVAERPADLHLTPRAGEGDAALHYHPILSLARRQLHDGQLPLWNPYSYAGMPLHGDMQSALLFPLTWLALTLPVETAFGWMALLKLLIAGLGAYAFARRLGVGRAGALVAGLVYELSAPLVLWVQHMLGTELALLPWLLLATDRLAERPDRRGVALVALAVTLGIFAGHPETAMLNTLAATVYLLVLVARKRSGWRAPAGFAAAHVLGAAGAAVAMVPFLVAYADSITREVHGADLQLPLSALLTYALPNVFGNGEPGYWGTAGYVTGGYFGVVAALLAGVALLRNRHDTRIVALAAAGLFMGLLALDLPPVSWIVDVLPFYRQAVTLRVLHVAALAGAVAAGLGVQSLMARPLPVRAVLAWSAGALGVGGVAFGVATIAGALPAPPDVEIDALLRFAAVLLVGAACLLALGRLRRALALTLVIAAVVGDLWYLQGHQALLPPDQAYPSASAGIRYLQSQPGPFRISVIRPAGRVPYVLPPNTPSLYGLEAIQGYDVPQPKRWADLSFFVLGERSPGGREVSLNSPPPSGPALTALRMMNTRYLVAAPGAVPPDPSLERVYAGRDLTIFRDPQALPRAYVVGSTRPMSDAAALATLARGGLAPRSEALVPPEAERLPGKGGGRPAREARFERLGDAHVRVHLPPGADGWLVVAQSYSRQWDAEVDGREVDTFPTNLAATGLRVRPGMRTVDLVYTRQPETVGGAISLGAFALMALLALYRRRGPRSAAEA